MEDKKIEIPEDLQQICRDMAKVAQQHNLIEYNGSFRPGTSWGGKVSFNWKAGRHGDDSDEITISSEFVTWTKVEMPKKESVLQSDRSYILLEHYFNWQAESMFRKEAEKWICFNNNQYENCFITQIQMEQLFKDKKLKLL